MAKGSDADFHLAYLEAGIAAARRSPLSARRARLAIHLLDAYADRLFYAGETGDADILAHRAALAEGSEALALVFDLAAAHPESPSLAVEAIRVPLTEYAALPVEDFMVSLYNGHTVQRLLVTLPDGSRRDAQQVIAAAMAA